MRFDKNTVWSSRPSRRCAGEPEALRPWSTAASKRRVAATSVCLSWLAKRVAICCAILVLGFPVFSAADMADDEIRELKQRIERLESAREEDRHRVDDEIDAVRKTADEAVKERTMDVVLTGYAHTLYRDRDGAPGSFLLGSFNPLLLARYRDNVLFEGELEFEVDREDGSSTETNIEVEYAQIDYLVNDALTLIMGRFITPLGVFNEKLHPAWINKLPNGPLPYGGHDASLLPFNDIGIQARGAFAVGDARLTYAAFVTNGPGQEAAHDEEEAAASIGGARNEDGEDEGESLDFESSAVDNNSSKNFGGRLALLPFPGVELGLSGTTGRYDDEGDLDFSVLVVDAAAQHFGFAELRGEWIRTWQERTASDIDRSAFWVQTSFKVAGIPSEPIQDALDSVAFMRRIEPVVRYSEVKTDETDADREQWSVGLNCYLTNTLLLKASYDFNDGEAAEDSNDTFNAQLAFGW